jgi:hypothetical protein
MDENIDIRHRLVGDCGVVEILEKTLVNPRGPHEMSCIPANGRLFQQAHCPLKSEIEN